MSTQPCCSSCQGHNTTDVFCAERWGKTTWRSYCLDCRCFFRLEFKPEFLTQSNKKPRPSNINIRDAIPATPRKHMSDRIVMVLAGLALGLAISAHLLLHEQRNDIRALDKRLQTLEQRAE